METKYQVIPLFPTPLYANKIPEQLILDHISLLNNEKTRNTPQIESEGFGEVSQNTYILNQPEYQNLKSYILQHVTYYTKSYLNYDYKNYTFSQSWISIKNPNQTHKPHTHSNSLVSGVIFYDNFTDETSKIDFYRNDSYSIGNNHPLGTNLNQFNYLSYSIPYQSNLLILFPSFLGHSVSKNLTNFPRKSLSFNIVPKEGFGTEETLNKLELLINE